ncbi:Elongator complex protein 2 [Podospora fimiseda]|uniref:Elongator complex protein 2 n=1 Tax=Podospora fimiseda TaxID=252190 RepID=A0AAN7BJY8_9PEZI|nr:Elongator complex protein 2 [Podospora fimiseda]
MTENIHYLSAGANRWPGASDWGQDGFVAFGAETNVCLWNPSNPNGISSILSQHTGTVRAVKFLPRLADEKEVLLLSGGDDKVLRVWIVNSEDGTATFREDLESHTEPINCISVLKPHEGGSLKRRIFVTGGADCTWKVWAYDASQGFSLLQTIKTSGDPRWIPLEAGLSTLDDEGSRIIMAVTGTINKVQIFTASTEDTEKGLEFTLQATLPGHENWVRALDFIREKNETGSDLLLASASQDKYIRIWRIHQGSALSALNSTGMDLTMASLTLGNKIHKITAGGTKYCIMFEALLLGHEDWIYSARWSRTADNKLQLLSASGDNSLSVWESDPDSGIWITVARLGEVSREKGATTATGSIGGFWTCHWSPSGTSIITFGRTGSWRRWDYNTSDDAWQQHYAISGHTRAVTGISWAHDGSYLLSTSTDQTTRLHAQWTGAGSSPGGTWHEMSRPQIHGYDLNCISTLGPTTSFVSGADEKLMRVFTEPKAVAHMLSRLTDSSLTPSDISAAPDAANMPVLGLSNKAIDVVDDDADLSALEASAHNSNADREALDPASMVRKSALDIDHPPFEESLSRHTLWPEVEKLYGHGYEISCLATSHDGKLIASACKATSLNHAVIRLFETEKWTEVRPPLQAHSLTVTRVRFSPDDRYLVSVGRDRQWTVFEKNQEGEEAHEYKLVQAKEKGHTRMILDAAWAPLIESGERVFATAGRDKQVKVWAKKQNGEQFELGKAVAEEQPVTALDFLPEVTKDGSLLLAVGTEAGKLLILTIKVTNGEVEVVETHVLKKELWLPKAVLQLAWRPKKEERKQEGNELAIAGEDGSVRIYSFKA